ncbi:ferric reductase [Scheffersomyces amazonensis]|uniref:ferric reductase n=1 Tax=Scheffersomyces amazonensis TaxID=1078765 RepID=UPI00315CA9B1
MAEIPFDVQFFVEKNRNNKFEWLSFLISAMLFIGHGVIFHWIPNILRSKRDTSSLKHRSYFKFVNAWDFWTGCVAFKLPYRKKTYYCQPSILLLSAIFLAINSAFIVVETADLDYLPRYYIISKRISRVGIGNLLTLMLMTAKNDILGAMSGLQHDRMIWIHIWLGRYIWTLITIHVIMGLIYWLKMDFLIMIIIPPQIFGMISYGCLCFLTWASLRFIRKLSYEFFIIQHKIFSFIMLLLAFFHNTGNRAMVLISVHLIVFDRILSKVISFIHKRKSPTKGICSFKKLDDDTISVTIPVKMMKFSYDKWYSAFLPKIGFWKAGQHIFLNVPKVNFFQLHPFTIASLPDSKHIKLIIRKQNGFTKKLMNKIEKMQTEDEELGTVVKLKCTFHGPYGAHYQSLLSFDTSLFFGAGAGAAFVFPVALDLLKTIKERDDAEDYLYRSTEARVHIIWAVKRHENTIWMKHLYDELQEFISNGKLTVQIHYTQEEKEYTSSNSELESPIVMSPDIIKNYGRPNLDSIIQEQTAALISDKHTSSYKALAVCACGPPEFTDQIKVACQANRKVKNAPDIYCYTEVF